MSDPEGDLVTELRALRISGGNETFVVRGATAEIEVRYVSGSSSSLTLRASYDAVARPDHEAIGTDVTGANYRRSARTTSIVAVRPLSIVLRSETRDDVVGKLEGINVEHQTGDAKFDDAVYVTSPTTDPHVLAAVLGPKVRQGVLALMVLGFQRVTIDDDGAVSALLSSFPTRKPTPGRGARAIEAFDLVLSDLPRITASGGAHPEVPAWTRSGPIFAAALVGVVAVIPATLGVASTYRCTEGASDGEGTNLRDGCAWPLVLGLPIALASAIFAGVVARRLATKVLRGRSDAVERIQYFSFAVFLLVALLTYFVTASVGFSFAHPK